MLSLATFDAIALVNSRTALFEATKQASTGDICDVTGSIASVAKRFGKAGNMNTEVSLNRDHIRPDSRDQFLAGDDLSGPFDQSDQYVERAAAQLTRLTRFLGQPFGHKQTKWAK
jgi:hypothetical protein